MAIDVEKYLALKKKAEESKAELNRVEGVLQEQTKKLKSDFNVDTIEDAEALLEALKREEAEAEEAYTVELASFESKWGGLL